MDLDDDELRVTREDFFKKGISPRIQLRKYCKYCDLDNGDFTYLVTNFNIKMERHSNDFFIVEEGTKDKIKIYYCPFCGRRLYE